MRMAETLFSQLTKLGYRVSMGSVRHLSDLEQRIKGYYGNGSVDKQFYQERLSHFKFSPPDSLPEARSVIVIAVPQPQIRIIFTWKGKKLPCMIPPTYVTNRETDRQLENLLRKTLSPENYEVAPVLLPKKLLAVQSGLGYYGKNNICYVEGMGSFHQLAAFYTDLPSGESDWREPQLMNVSKNCSACLRNCPTGAISTDRFLLHAERCITFHNERPGNFPDWIDPRWHNCLVGCLHCQSVCPEDKDFLDWIEEKEEFSEEETTLLLEAKRSRRLPSSLLAKLEQLELVDYVDFLPRNLHVLFDKEEHSCGVHKF